MDVVTKVIQTETLDQGFRLTRLAEKPARILRGRLQGSRRESDSRAGRKVVNTLERISLRLREHQKAFN